MRIKVLEDIHVFGVDQNDKGIEAYWPANYVFEADVQPHADKKRDYVDIFMNGLCFPSVSIEYLEIN